MKKSTVDVIIPVYKTENYLEECVESVLLQDYPYIQMILVDDGSPDHCPELCDRYAEMYKNISVIHQKNSGPGFSRNAGMEASGGDYILFLDSDDKLDGRHVISHLVCQAEKTGADITVGSFRRFHSGYISEPNHHHLRSGNYTKTVDFRFQGFFRYGHLAYNWGKLYRRSFLEQHGLKCISYPLAEDKAYNMMCCVYEPVYAFIEESICQYRVNQESVTSQYHKNLMTIWISIAKDFLSFLKKQGIKKHYGDLIAFHIFFGSFFLVKQEFQKKTDGCSILKAVKIMREYGREPLVKQAMKQLAKGRYMKKISPLSWKIVIRGAAVLFFIHGYFFYVFGIAILQKLQIDKKISHSRYKK